MKRTDIPPLPMAGSQCSIRGIRRVNSHTVGEDGGGEGNGNTVKRTKFRKLRNVKDVGLHADIALGKEGVVNDADECYFIDIHATRILYSIRRATSAIQPGLSYDPTT